MKKGQVDLLEYWLFHWNPWSFEAIICFSKLFCLIFSSIFFDFGEKNHHTICLIFELLGKISWIYSFWGHEFEFFLTGVISQILIKSLNRCYFMPQALKASLIFQHFSPNSRPDKLKEFFLNSSQFWPKLRFSENLGRTTKIVPRSARSGDLFSFLYLNTPTFLPKPNHFFLNYMESFSAKLKEFCSTKSKYFLRNSSDFPLNSRFRKILFVAAKWLKKVD